MFTINAGMLNSSLGKLKPRWAWIFCAAKKNRNGGKEILMHLIAYNCVRRLMLEAAEKKGVKLRRISFKGSLQALRQWEPHLNHRRMSRNDKVRLIRLLTDSISENITTERLGRSEPRAVKRRPKPHQLLTAPRHEMKGIKHRGKYAKSA